MASPDDRPVTLGLGANAGQFALLVGVRLTSDCLSAEKREGTLGLLFLTNLKARDIVIAKVFSHGLRSLTMWAATLPIIAVPLLLD